MSILWMFDAGSVGAFPAGFEPTAPELGILCSIRLSYGNSAMAVISRQGAMEKIPGGRLLLRGSRRFTDFLNEIHDDIVLRSTSRPARG